MAAKKNQTALSAARRTHTTNNSHIDEDGEATNARISRDPMINHYQKRLHTRGPSYTGANNEDLGAMTHNPAMVRTV